ncbi:MAG: MarR family transcriptional regulator, partial [Candidatus Hodarchaeales archaeon]
FSSLVEGIKLTPIPQVNVPKNDTLLEIKRDFIFHMVELSSDLIGGNEELISVFLALFLEYDPVTQDELMEITGSSRSAVSKTLSIMEELKIVQIVKNPGDRKKYYKGASSLESYGAGKLQRVQGYYAQIQKMMKEKFLPDLAKIVVTEEKDKTEQQRLQKFFENNIFFYRIFIKFATLMHEAISVELRKIMNSGSET